MIAWGVNPQLCRGTSHALGDNLAHMLSHNGVDYVEAVGVERILVERGRATAVVLEDGTVVHAKRFIASNVNPVETFIKLCGAENLDADFSARAAGFRFSKTTPIFATNLALNERPRYVTEDEHPEVAGSFMHIVGLETYEDLRNLFNDCRSGQLPRKPFMNGATPSHHDPTQAPPGKATAFMWQLAPYNLWGQSTQLGQGQGRVVRAATRCVAPVRPQPHRRQYPVARLHHAAGHRAPRPQHVRGGLDGRRVFRDQALENRPFPGWSQYRTPVSGLYLCAPRATPAATSPAPRDTTRPRPSPGTWG